MKDIKETDRMYTYEELRRIIDKAVKEERNRLLDVKGGGKYIVSQTFGSFKGPIRVIHNITNIYSDNGNISIELEDKPLPDSIHIHRCEECKLYYDKNIT